MGDVKESVKRGLKQGLLLVAGIILIAGVLTAIEMLSESGKPPASPKNNQENPSDPRSEVLKLLEHRPPPKEIEVPEDHSLSVQDYIQRGCPTPDRIWKLGDLFKARTVFTTSPLLTGEKRPPVPRFESPRSGEFFARITTARNFEPIRDKSIPVKDRLEYNSAYGTNLVGFYDLYSEAFALHEVGDSEMVEICGLYLQLVAWWKELVDESLQTTKKDDPAYQDFVEGANKGKQGWAIIVNLGLTILANKEYYRASERLKLLGYMKKTVPAVALGLTADARADLLRRVQEMSKDPEQKPLQDDLKAFQQLILKADLAK